MKRNLLRVGLLIFGLGLLGGLLWKVGPEKVWNNIRQVGWGFFILLGLGLIWHLFATAAWRVLFDRNHPSVGYLTLLRIRLVGEALNTLTPLMNLGGEPLKVWLMRRHLGGASEGASYVLLDKTIYLLAALLYIGSGLAAGLTVLSGHPAVLAAAGGLFLALISALVWFIWRQARGRTTSQLITPLEKVGLKLSGKTRERLAEVDAVMARFWAEHRGRFLLALLLHFLGRALRVVDLLTAIWLLGLSLGLLPAYFISAAAVLINAVFAAIWGPYEAGHGFLFKAVGLSLSAGFSIGIIRRVRTLTFAGLSYLLLVAGPGERGGPESEMGRNS